VRSKFSRFRLSWNSIDRQSSNKPRNSARSSQQHEPSEAPIPKCFAAALREGSPCFWSPGRRRELRPLSTTTPSGRFCSRIGLIL